MYESNQFIAQHIFYKLLYILRAFSQLYALKWLLRVNMIGQEQNLKIIKNNLFLKILKPMNSFVTFQQILIWWIFICLIFIWLNILHFRKFLNVLLVYFIISWPFKDFKYRKLDIFTNTIILSDWNLKNVLQIYDNFRFN